MAIKRKVKRTAKRKLKLKLKPKRNVVTVKRKAVTRGEGILERELGRLPTREEVEEWIRNHDAEREAWRKLEAAKFDRRSDEYKALAERWAAPYAGDSKPKTPAELLGRQRAFGQAWWPLPVAVAWVATRDRNFVEVSLDKSMRRLAVALAKYAADVKGFKSASLPYKNSHDAFLALRDATAQKGGIQAVGYPYRWVPERPPRMVCEPRRTIDPLEIVSAVCRDDHGIPDCLVPELKRPHGSRFQNVCFLRKDVLARFPALQATLATARNESAAAEAFSTYIAEHTTRPDAEAWLKERGYNLGPRAFQRVWRKARELKGLTPLAPPGRKRSR